MLKPDSGTQQRVERLKALEADTLAAAGYAPGDPVPPDVLTRAHMGAVLRLAYEQLEARLLTGQIIDASEMPRVTEAINALLPARRVAPLEVRFIDSDGNSHSHVEGTITGEERRLTNERDHARREAEGLRAENYRLRQQILDAGEKTRSPFSSRDAWRSASPRP